MLSLRKNTAVCWERMEQTILENSPKYASASMGAIEVANRLMEGQMRTIRGRLEQVLKIQKHITNPIVPWIVRHAS